MALYALGDTHLSLSAQKPMDVFGGAWSGYVDKLRRGLSVLREESIARDAPVPQPSQTEAA